MPKGLKAVRCTLVLLAVAFTACQGRGSASRTPPAAAKLPRYDPAAVNEPLRHFSQEITSAVKTIRLRGAESTLILVNVKNTMSVVIGSAGHYPVRLSYRWLDGSKALPVEGERALLPRALAPNESATVELKVIAPGVKADRLAVTLLQEGVQWFDIAGAPALEIPAEIVP